MIGTVDLIDVYVNDCIGYCSRCGLIDEPVHSSFSLPILF